MTKTEKWRITKSKIYKNICFTKKLRNLKQNEMENENALHISIYIYIRVGCVVDWYPVRIQNTHPRVRFPAKASFIEMVNTQ